MSKANGKTVKATELNLWVLRELMAGKDEAPNRVEATAAPHLRRCMKAGLLVVAPDKQTLRLTDAGRAALSTK